MTSGITQALRTEVMKKAAVVWLQVGVQAPVLVWAAWKDDDFGPALYLVHGGAEQRVPGLTEAATCEVIARASDGAKAISWQARIEHLAANSPQWVAAVELLLPKRLNLTDAPTAAIRWADSSIISALTPVD